MTWNKDRKQTIYGHKRREHMTHTTEPWHNSPLPEGVSHAVTVPPGRGGGRSGGPSEQTRTGTQDGDLQSGTDNGGHGGAGSSGGHGGAGSSGGHGGAGSSGSHGRWSSGPLASVPSARPLQPEPLLPPPPQKKISLGKLGGIRSPPGLDTDKQYMDSPPGLNTQEQDRTGQPSGAKQTGTGQDSPQEQEALQGLLGSWGFLWAWRVRGPHRGPQQPLSYL